MVCQEGVSIAGGHLFSLGQTMREIQSFLCWTSGVWSRRWSQVPRVLPCHTSPGSSPATPPQGPPLPHLPSNCLYPRVVMWLGGQEIFSGETTCGGQEEQEEQEEYDSVCFYTELNLIFPPAKLNI